jgi:hypothetical protein
MWACVFPLASGCFTPNRNSETNTSQGKVDYTILNTIFYYVWIVREYQFILFKEAEVFAPWS